ncbi:oxidation resistance protein 1-like isoform X2 [Arachis ipaensis]|uniref:oxidation resistance protein 1-like isoform X2 n=1 Tax=Arachis ipaensis TaxID=130454 RepID=UPI000A2B743F|nr:oxidation resistance protein 1-like isoform X2 [Arachis ipaensis]XP_025672342.1 oxidation resistance protein 1-like isoform X2 [Arachis hypogaea]
MDWFQMLVITFQVVGDQRGAVFGSLVEAPLRPSNKKYQGTNSTFVFTNISGHPVIYRPTGLTRYFTLCNSEFLAIGGGSHFAVYLDGDLLNGSRSVSETYENPCLANSQDFEVKEVELWGFVYASKYDEVLAFNITEAPGICRW